MNENIEEVRHDLLSEWLLMGGYAEAERGYGHVSADDLATALLNTFEMYYIHERKT